jgi:multicomponent Na+:H+ antiporter subunit D
METTSFLPLLILISSLIPGILILLLREEQVACGLF